MIIPTDFEKSKLAPRNDELIWMHRQLRNKSINSVLEFGCGITTWIIHKATSPNLYVAIEEYAPCIREVRKHLKDVVIISAWSDIPEGSFDLVFVDSSAGCGKKGLHRVESAQRAHSQLKKGGYMMIHDSHRRSGRAVSRYLKNSEHYKLLASFGGRTGVEIFQKV